MNKSDKKLIRRLLNSEIGSELTVILTDLVDFDGLGYDQPKENTLECAANTLFNEAIKGIPSRGKSPSEQFKEALQGLPTYISVPFYNYDIEQLMYSIGYEGENAVEIYWDLCGEILAYAHSKAIKYAV